MRSIAVAIVRFEPIVLAALAIPLLFPTPVRALSLLAIPALWIMRRYASGHFVPRTPLDWAILLLLIMVLVALFATFDLAFSLPKLTGLLLGVAVYYAAAAGVSSLNRMKIALTAFIAAGSLVAVLGLIGTRWLFKLPLLSAITQRLPSIIVGLPGAESGFHPNEVAGTLIWFIPLQLVLLARTRRPRFIPWFLLAGSLALTGGTLLLTQSRGAWLGLATALAALGAIVSRPLRIFIGFATLVGLAAFMVVGPTDVGAWLFGSETQEFTGTLSIDFRLHVWRAAVWGVGDFPFTGMGLGTFRRVARVLYPLPIPADYDIAHAHNHFLQASVDLGLPGLVAYAALWLGAAHLLIRTYRSARDGRLSALALGLGGGMLAYFVYGLTDAVALGAKPGFIFWMSFGLIVATHQLAVRDVAPSENPHDQLASAAV